MTLLYLVRHAKPAAGWGEAVDPGIDALGLTQAQERAKDLHARLPRLNVYTSPLKRCVETARPLATLWRTEPAVLQEVAEIPSPPIAPRERAEWLAAAMQGTWSELQGSAPLDSPDYSRWRETLLQTLLKFRADSVIYTHYIAINVAVGCAQGHDRVLSFRPGHASVTTLENTGERLSIRELGEESDGAVLLGTSKVTRGL